MVSVNIEQTLWIPFLQQSVGLQDSASNRIRQFIIGELEQERIKKEVQKNESNNNYTG